MIPESSLFLRNRWTLRPEGLTNQYSRGMVDVRACAEVFVARQRTIRAVEEGASRAVTQSDVTRTRMKLYEWPRSVIFVSQIW